MAWEVLTGLAVELVLLAIAFGLGACRRQAVVLPSPLMEAEMAELRRRLLDALERDEHLRLGPTQMPRTQDGGEPA
jgi:hypothetical protein